jgi:signal transduction histidine kinase
MTQLILTIIFSILTSYITLSVLKSVGNDLFMDGNGFAIFAVVLVNYIQSFIGRDIFYAIVSFTVFIIYFIIFSYKKVKTFIDIFETVEDMASGNLNRTINIKSKDLMGQLANNMNQIVFKLNKSIEEERRAEQTKNDLITNVSHDLRTPLTSIIGYLGLIDDDKYKDEVQMRHYVNIAYEKSKGLNVLINDLFELTKMRNKGVKLDKSIVNLGELLGQLVAQFELQFKNSKMESRLYLSNDKLMLDVDPIKLVRAFENLITNAIHYGKEGKYVDIVTIKEEDTVVIQFINYGEPIPVVDLHHIFERFYRVEKSRSLQSGGSGLGLSITKHIIELHNGTISVDSNYDRTVFEVRIPINIITTNRI